MTDVLEEAQRLYNEGKWTEAVTLLNENLPGFTKTEDIAEALRLKGWCFYYIGIKGPEEEKMEALRLSRNMFDIALGKTFDAKKKLSIFNGLPLTLWILGEEERAWEISDQAVTEFQDEPSVWNTRSILCRWAKDFNKSVDVCEMVYKIAFDRKDYRTAGHGKQNKADALKELHEIDAARNEYIMAVGLYVAFEKTTSESVQFHIEGALNKLAALNDA